MILSINRQYTQKYSSFIKIWQVTSTLHEDLCNSMYLANFLLKWEMLQTNVVEKIKTHILCSINVYAHRTVYEITWKYIVIMPDWPHTIRRMRTTSRITKVTDTHSEYEIFIAFPRQQWLRKRALCHVYTYIACLFRLPPQSRCYDPWRRDRHVVPRPRLEITTTLCVMTQKSAVLIAYLVLSSVQFWGASSPLCY